MVCPGDSGALPRGDDAPRLTLDSGRSVRGVAGAGADVAEADCGRVWAKSSREMRPKVGRDFPPSRSSSRA